MLGDIGGGFRLPGSETSIRVYGYAEVHLIHDAGRSGPSDNFTDLMFQPVGSEVANNPRLGLKGKTKLTAQTSHFGFETSTPTSAGTFNTKVEADFYAYNGIEQGQNRNRLRLRQAYGEYAGVLVGQEPVGLGASKRSLAPARTVLASPLSENVGFAAP